MFGLELFDIESALGSLLRPAFRLREESWSHVALAHLGGVFVAHQKRLKLAAGQFLVRIVEFESGENLDDIGRGRQGLAFFLRVLHVQLDHRREIAQTDGDEENAEDQSGREGQLAERDARGGGFEHGGAPRLRWVHSADKQSIITAESREDSTPPRRPSVLVPSPSADRGRSALRRRACARRRGRLPRSWIHRPASAPGS